ncbi:hypothetical protein [Amycolatopsis sp. NPDC004169]|uniref:hypothetical protein n=1 Tax=Amycolatopsis sp. NPDC004169 TaxID=3154453 RepID=UPI0033AE98EE
MINCSTGVPRVQTFEVDVPMMRRRTGGQLEPPLSANDRWHWTQENQRTQAFRLGVRDDARRAEIPAGSCLVVSLHYRPGDNRRRDADNLYPTLKAACDAPAGTGSGSSSSRTTPCAT